MSKPYILRIQSPEHGTKRISSKPTERLSDFLDKVQKEFALTDTGWALYQSRDKTGELRQSRSKTLNTYKVKHGDMLYLFGDLLLPSSHGDAQPSVSGSSGMSNGSHDGSTGSSIMSGASGQPVTTVVEDEVDQILEKMDGRIHRDRNEQLCRHGPAGKCFHCVPIEPYDEAYLKQVDPPIKFLSFHSHIRKLTGGVDKGKFAKFENLSCKIKPGCKEHPPWPGGICTKCQPNAVTLNRQKYRHVDYVQFENPLLVDQFLNYWRESANQRIGIMYGRYELHTALPLAIKAVVAAIYEPPQKGTRKSVELLEDVNASVVRDVAVKLGLRPVGWIFTDLIAEDVKSGTVKHFRGNIESHFLSAEECIMAAHFQNEYPNPCKLSYDGYFGSKFVTVAVTGDKENKIHFEAYQVSDQGVALVRDDCMIPTLDAPELAYIKESSNEQYVPDVFYKLRDGYGNEVTQIARPLPVEYLLVDIAVAFPVDPIYMFYAQARQFPIESRQEVGEIQDFNSFTTYMQQFAADDFLKAVSNFHLLIFMATCDLLPLRDHMASLLQVVRSQDQELAHHWRKTEEWATVEQLMAAHMPSPTASGPNSNIFPDSGAGSSGAGAGGMPQKWPCEHCTFINQSDQHSCEICGLPRQGGV